MLYCTVLPIMAAATPDGVLRVLDRFDLISWSGTLTPIARAILAGIAFVAGAPFAAYVAIWFFTDLIGDLYPWYLGWRELRRNGLLAGIRPTLKPDGSYGRVALRHRCQSRQPASRRSGARSAASSSADCSDPPARPCSAWPRHSPTGAQKPADLLGKAFYPEIMRMDLTSKKPWKLMLRGTALVTALAVLAILILLIGGKPIMKLIFGKAFLGAYTPLMILMAIPFLGIFSFPLTPMLYALGRSDGPLKAKLLGSTVFFVTIAPLSWTWGVTGAAMALVLANVVNTGMMMMQLRGEHRRVRPKPALEIGLPEAALLHQPVELDQA